MPNFQICSYNTLAQAYIHHSLQLGIMPSYCEWSARKQKIEDFLSTQQETLIIGLQEIEANFSDDIKVMFPNHQSYFEQRPYRTEGIFLLIHHRCIVEEYSKIILYNTKGTARRVVQVVDCLYERLQFRVIHLHLDHDAVGKKDGFEQMKAVLRSHRLRQPLPTLIFGDFNTTEGHQTFELLVNDGFICIDVSKPSCFHNNAWSRVDHIFHTENIKTSHISIPTVRSKSLPNAQWGSDHLPITCQIILS